LTYITCQFGDVLPSQCLGLVLKKENPTKRKQATQDTQKKQNLNLNQHANLRTQFTCVCVCLSLCAIMSYTIQQRTVLIIFPLNIQCSNAVYWRAEGATFKSRRILTPQCGVDGIQGRINRGTEGRVQQIQSLLQTKLNPCQQYSL